MGDTVRASRSLEELPALITLEEAAGWLRLDVAEVRAVAGCGVIPGTLVIGDTFRFRLDAFTAWALGQPSTEGSDPERGRDDEDAI